MHASPYKESVISKNITQKVLTYVKSTPRCKHKNELQDRHLASLTKKPNHRQMSPSRVRLPAFAPNWHISDGISVPRDARSPCALFLLFLGSLRPAIQVPVTILTGIADGATTVPPRCCSIVRQFYPICITLTESQSDSFPCRGFRLFKCLLSDKWCVRVKDNWKHSGNSTKAELKQEPPVSEIESVWFLCILWSLVFHSVLYVSLCRRLTYN